MSDPILYTPKYFVLPPRVLDVPSAWRGIESILADVIDRFNIRQNGRALEFGVDYGYSTAAIANYFATVIGVDTFEGDVHAGDRESDFFLRVSENIASFDNVLLVKSDYRDWIVRSRGHYDFVHIDIVHTFEDTYLAGAWAAEVSPVVAFHDTRSFPEVMRAVSALADRTGMKFYEWPECHGFGILVKQ